LLDPAAPQNGQQEFLPIYFTVDSQQEAEQRWKTSPVLDNITHSRVPTGYAAPAGVDIHNAKISLPRISSE